VNYIKAISVLTCAIVACLGAAGCSKQPLSLPTSIGPSGPSVPNDLVRKELAELEGQGFLSFDDARWTDFDRKAMHIVWDIFIVQGGFSTTSFIPRYKIDHGVPNSIVMQWVYFDSNGNPLVLCQPSIDG